MSNFFKSTAKQLEDSPWVIVIFILFAYMIKISFHFFLEDYQANIAVVSMIPTRKALPDLTGDIARFIQLAPVVFGFVFLRDTQKRWAALTSLVFLAFDWGLGIYFRDPHQGLQWTLYTAAEDFMLFTMGSEVLLTISVGTTIALFPAAFRELLSGAGILVSAVGHGFSSFHFTPSNRSFNSGKISMPTEPTERFRPPLPNEGNHDKEKAIKGYLFSQYKKNKNIPGPSEIARDVGVAKSWAAEVRAKWVNETKDMRSKNQ